MQKHHDVADSLLLGPSRGDLVGTEFADAGHFPEPFRGSFDDFESRFPKTATILFASLGPMPRVMPEPRYFSMPSAVVGAVVSSTSALN